MKSYYSLSLFIIFAILSSSILSSFAHDKTTLKRGKNLYNKKNKQQCANPGKPCSDDYSGGRYPCCPNQMFCGGPCQCIDGRCSRSGSSSGQGWGKGGAWGSKD